MEGVEDVQGGVVRAGAAGLHGGGDEHAGGCPGVRAAPGYGAQDAGVLGATRVSSSVTAPPPQAGAFHRRHRPDTGVGPERSQEAAPHGQADLRAAAGRARVWGPVHQRQGLRQGAPPPDTGDVCSAVPSCRTRPVRLRPGEGGGRRSGADRPLLRPGPALQRRLLHQGLLRGDHGGLPGRPRLGLRLPGRGAPEHPLRQHQAGGGQDPGGRPAKAYPSLHRAPVPLPVRGPVRQAREGQRQGEGGGHGGATCAATSWCRFRPSRASRR